MPSPASLKQPPWPRSGAHPPRSMDAPARGPGPAAGLVRAASALDVGHGPGPAERAAGGVVLPTARALGLERVLLGHLFAHGVFARTRWTGRARRRHDGRGNGVDLRGVRPRRRVRRRRRRGASPFDERCCQRRERTRASDCGDALQATSRGRAGRQGQFMLSYVIPSLRTRNRLRGIFDASALLRAPELQYACAVGEASA
jgi:hypothetical protein